MENTLIEVEIDKIVNGGYGLGRLNGLVHLVPFAYPGDVVLIKPFQRQKNLVWGYIEKMIKSSPNRQNPLCTQMGSCGGCMWGMLDYKKQIEYKKQLIEENILSIKENEKLNIEILYDVTNLYHYRTRVIYHGDGKTLGFYKFHSRKIMDVSKCIITHKKIENIRNKLINKNINKNVYITINPDAYEFLIYPTNIHKYISNKDNCKKNNTNNSKYQDFFIYDNVPIVNGCFSQNSLILNKMLRSKVKELLQNDEKILDLYCGSGNFTVDLDKKKNVVGIDIDQNAIKKAKECSNFSYISGNEDKMCKYLIKENWDTVILDPPRTGAKKIIPYLTQTKTKKIIYISCDPVTMCRDAKVLIQKGWDLQKVIGIDMFPHTPHIESIMVLIK